MVFWSRTFVFWRRYGFRSPFGSSLLILAGESIKQISPKRIRTRECVCLLFPEANASWMRVRRKVQVLELVDSLKTRINSRSFEKLLNYHIIVIDFSAMRPMRSSGDRLIVEASLPRLPKQVSGLLLLVTIFDSRRLGSRVESTKLSQRFVSRFKLVRV